MSLVALRQWKRMVDTSVYLLLNTMAEHVSIRAIYGSNGGWVAAFLRHVSDIEGLLEYIFNMAHTTQAGISVA